MFPGSKSMQLTGLVHRIPKLNQHSSQQKDEQKEKINQIKRNATTKIERKKGSV